MDCAEAAETTARAARADVFEPSKRAEKDGISRGRARGEELKRVALCHLYESEK